MFCSRSARRCSPLRCAFCWLIKWPRVTSHMGFAILFTTMRSSLSLGPVALSRVSLVHALALDVDVACVAAFSTCSSEWLSCKAKETCEMILHAFSILPSFLTGFIVVLLVDELLFLLLFLLLLFTRTEGAEIVSVTGLSIKKRFLLLSVSFTSMMVDVEDWLLGLGELSRLLALTFWFERVFIDVRLGNGGSANDMFILTFELPSSRACLMSWKSPKGRYSSSSFRSPSIAVLVMIK